MTDLTQRELFDAIERSLRRTARRFAHKKAAPATKQPVKARTRAAKSKAPSRKSRQRIIRRKTRA